MTLGRAVLGLILILGIAACSTAPAGDDAGTDGSLGAAPDAAAAGDAGADAGSLPYSDAGCLTFDGVSQVCGFKSDGKVCAFSTQCKSSSDLGQCKINCEMGTSVGKCYGPSDVSCLLNSVSAQDCAALAACHWVL